jgi:two-component system, OmpR family, phosphate regulon sensor histidine kinase PhoR
MPVDAPSSFLSSWPDRLRHSAIILLAAALALAALVISRELSPAFAVAVFACIAGAALIPWRLHNPAPSSEDVAL